MGRIISLSLALASALVIPSGSGMGQAEVKIAERALPAKSMPVHSYQVIFRVVQPIWREQPPPGKQLAPKFAAILEDGFVLTNPLSDSQFLQNLNRGNPQFRVDKVLRRVTVTSPTDKRLTLPGNFSIHQIWLAVVEKDRTLFRAEPMSASGAVSQVNVKTVNKKPVAALSPTRAIYKCGMKEADLRRLYREGKVVLSFNAKQFYLADNKKWPHMMSDSCQIMDNGATVCLTRNLPVKIQADGSPQLMPNDCVFVTVTEVQPASPPLR